jgi:two-component system, NtrC family, nitrogen regulation sensor histidine kinase NtrY
VSLRQKLLLLFSLTVAAAVAAVAWAVLVRIRDVFERRDQEETALFVSQFQQEFQHRSAEVATAVSRLASSESARAMAFQLNQSGDSSLYLTAAQTMAQDAQLNFLEIVGSDGNVISSAQWPAKFGFPEPAAAYVNQPPFLKREELPDGTTALGLFAVRSVGDAASGVRLVGGERLDQDFLSSLPVAPGMTVGLYSDAGSFTTTLNLSTGANTPPVAIFDPSRLLGVNGALPGANHYRSLIDSARKNGQQTSRIVNLTTNRADSLNATAIPLKDASGNVIAVLTVAISRSGMVEAQQHIRTIAYGIAGAGILLSIVFSLWIAARVSRPIEQLARAAEDVAGGNWDVRVPERGRDEVSVLARSFNHMTTELTTQRERLVQSERVAAWRELARRLAHELKNPLFPLQLTVENLVRARALPPVEFDEVFLESTATLTAEIANLKKIVGRFSDFSKMPKPELERIDASAAVWDVALLHFPGIARVMGKPQTIAGTGPEMSCCVELSLDPMPLMADPALLHRALSNLVLNAMDAMPNGGVVTLSAHPKGETVELCVADTGEGLTPEECERLFTPYYTTKQHGTGLGLAIVQSVIADHAGTIAVESRADAGAAFIITLPMSPNSGAES